MDHAGWVDVLIRDVGRDPANAVQDRHFLVEMVKDLHHTIDALASDAGD